MSAALEQVGHDRSSGRDLLFLQASSPMSLTAFRAPSRHFVSLLVWDSVEESVETVSRVGEQLLESGCAYLCAWGEGCERVHDIFDEVFVGSNPNSAGDSVVMTTWHAQESLAEALWFFLRSAFPDERYEDSCRSSVAIVVGADDERIAAVRRALAEPGMDPAVAGAVSRAMMISGKQ